MPRGQMGLELTDNRDMVCRAMPKRFSFDLRSNGSLAGRASRNADSVAVWECATQNPRATRWSRGSLRADRRRQTLGQSQVARETQHPDSS